MWPDHFSLEVSMGWAWYYSLCVALEADCWMHFYSQGAVADNGRVHVASGYKGSWTLSDKLNIFYMHSLSFCMHWFICLVHISHTCNLCHNIKALVISIEREILLLNLPSVLGFTQRKLVRRCEIAGSLDGRYNILNATVFMCLVFKVVLTWLNTHLYSCMQGKEWLHNSWVDKCT